MATIIFDFDGTIADSFETVVQLFHDLTGRHDRVPAEEIERLRGMSLVHAAEELQIRPWKMPVLLYRGRRQIAQQIMTIPLHPGIKGSIIKLYDEGHQLFIVSSNSRKNIQRFLVHHELNTQFIDIVGGVGLLGKARVLTKLVKRNRLDPQTTWYVGDEVRDVVSAQHAELKVMAVSWGYNNADILRHHEPTRLVTTPAELLTILEEI